MSNTATIADIAARAGVGTATVDRVLNKRPGVNAETVQRVAAGQSPNRRAAARAAAARTANFAFASCCPADESPFLDTRDRGRFAQSGATSAIQHIHRGHLSDRQPADGS
jgi:LacI family transcriptional regulator